MHDYFFGVKKNVYMHDYFVILESNGGDIRRGNQRGLRQLGNGYEFGQKNAFSHSLSLSLSLTHSLTHTLSLYLTIPGRLSFLGP
jgi:hypothetical protein